MSKKVHPWEPWPSAWFGYEVWRLHTDWGFGSSYRAARNFIGLRKWFLTQNTAQRYADKLNGTTP